MKTDEMPVYCPLCQFSRFEHYGSTTCLSLGVSKDADVQRDLYKCKNCGSISMHPVPSYAELNEYYSNYADIDACFVGEDGWRKRKSYHVILDICKRLESGSVLDIGCADGKLLDILPSSFQKFGIDISEKACALAREKGISVQCSSLESAKFLEGFDIVIAMDLLEHMDDPRQAVKQIGDLLSPGGYVIIETGNASSLVAKLLKGDWSYTSVYGHL